MGKSCGKCGVEKDLACFTRSRDHAFGVQSWCKECTAAYHRAYRKTEAGKAAAKRSKGRSKPEDKTALKARNASSRNELRDRYVRVLIAAQTGVQYGLVTPEMVCAKRDELVARRTMLSEKMELRNEIKETAQRLKVLRAKLRGT